MITIFKLFFFLNHTIYSVRALHCFFSEVLRKCKFKKNLDQQFTQRLKKILRLIFEKNHLKKIKFFLRKKHIIFHKCDKFHDGLIFLSRDMVKNVQNIQIKRETFPVYILISFC